MKTDGRRDRNFRIGQDGDRINAILCGAGHNFRLLLRLLRLFLRLILDVVLSMLGRDDDVAAPA